MIHKTCLVVCCQCRKFLFEKESEEYEDDEIRISHTYCESCAKEAMAEIREFKQEQEGNTCLTN